VNITAEYPRSDCFRAECANYDGKHQLATLQEAVSVVLKHLEGLIGLDHSFWISGEEKNPTYGKCQEKLSIESSQITFDRIISYSELYFWQLLTRLIRWIVL